jgi:hypothetical protein
MLLRRRARSKKEGEWWEGSSHGYSGFICLWALRSLYSPREQVVVALYVRVGSFTVYK